MSSYLTVSAQYNLNDYKYVIVEKQFHFQNEENEYHLNRLVKFQFKKYGFNAIIEGEPLPDDLKSNYCLALNSEVKAKGTLRTKVMITLTDCDNNLVFATAEGVTKEKDYRRTYELGIRKAFGASVSKILILLSKVYISLITIAFIVAIPISNYFVTEWLKNFAYQTRLNWWIFGIAGVSVGVIALIAVAGKSIQAARNNPANSLRSE